MCSIRLQEPLMTQRFLSVLTNHGRKGPAGAADAAGQNRASAKGVAEAMLPLLVAASVDRA